MIQKSTLPEDVRSVRRISFETKVLLESADALVLQALLKKLNEATRRAFVRLNAKSLSAKKRLGSKDLLGSNVIQEGVFTAHQASMIGRSALGAYRLAAANAKVYEQKIQEMIEAVEKKIATKKADLTSLMKVRSAPSVNKPSVTPIVKDLQKLEQKRRKREQLEHKALQSLLQRYERLEAKRMAVQKALQQQSFSHVFGSRHLLKQRSLLQEHLSPLDTTKGVVANKASAARVPCAYTRLQDWQEDWVNARDHHWLFEGSADAPGANCSVKMIAPEASHSGMGPSSPKGSDTLCIKVRLTEEQARERLKSLCEQKGIDFEKAQSVKNVKYSPLRVQSEWLTLSLKMPTSLRHMARLQALYLALERKSKGFGANPKALVHASAISWSLRCHKSTWYATASWEVETPVLQTSGKLGVLGIDINAASIEWAVCKADGSPGGRKREKRLPVALESTSDPTPSSTTTAAPMPTKTRTPSPEDIWCGAIPMRLQGADKNHSLHIIRHVVLQIVDLAGRKGVPIAIEALDFSRKKAALRYENDKTAKNLSGFAYGKFKEELLRCAAKKGLQVLLVDPAWTSVAGGVKYASHLGLSIDKAAATIEYIFKPKNVVGLIARSAALSTPRDCTHRFIGGQWVKVASRKEMPPPKMQGIWLEELKKAQDAKSKAVKKRGPPKVPKAQQASIPEERGVWAFWKWTGAQLGRARSGWGKRLKELLTKDVSDGAGNPSAVRSSTGFKTPELTRFQQVN